MTFSRTTDTTFLIEANSNSEQDNEGWYPTVEAPKNLDFTVFAQNMSLPTWIAYVDYLNTRELEKPDSTRLRYRLMQCRTTKELEVLHV